MMTQVERRNGEFIVPAALIGDVFDMSEEAVRQAMREGAITSRCEVGQGDDAGRWRLSFRKADVVFRLTVDGDGRILSRSRFAAPRPGKAG